MSCVVIVNGEVKEDFNKSLKDMITFYQSQTKYVRVEKFLVKNWRAVENKNEPEKKEKKQLFFLNILVGDDMNSLDEHFWQSKASQITVEFDTGLLDKVMRNFFAVLRDALPSMPPYTPESINTFLDRFRDW